MQIITPDNAVTAQAVVNGNYVTLSHEGAELILPAMARPDNYSDTIYLADGNLQFLPGNNPVIAAVLACHAGAITLTLFPLTIDTQPEEA